MAAIAFAWSAFGSSGPGGYGEERQAERQHRECDVVHLSCPFRYGGQRGFGRSVEYRAVRQCLLKASYAQRR